MDTTGDGMLDLAIHSAGFYLWMLVDFIKRQHWPAWNASLI